MCRRFLKIGSGDLGLKFKKSNNSLGLTITKPCIMTPFKNELIFLFYFLINLFWKFPISFQFLEFLL